MLRINNQLGKRKQIVPADVQLGATFCSGKGELLIIARESTAIDEAPHPNEAKFIIHCMARRIVAGETDAQSAYYPLGLVKSAHQEELATWLNSAQARPIDVMLTCTDI